MLTCKKCGEAIAMSGIHRCPGFQKPTPDPLRVALVAIQNEHPKSDHFAFGSYYCLTCLNDYPCNTRRLADDALGGDQHG